MKLGYACSIRPYYIRRKKINKIIWKFVYIFLKIANPSKSINCVANKLSRMKLFNASQIDLFYAIRLKFPPDCCCVLQAESPHPLYSTDRKYKAMLLITKKHLLGRYVRKHLNRLLFNDGLITPQWRIYKVILDILLENLFLFSIFYLEINEYGVDGAKGF